MRAWMNVLIFLTQFVGVFLVGIGLAEIWHPLALIYTGITAFAFGHLLYRAMESEERRK